MIFLVIGNFNSTQCFPTLCRKTLGLWKYGLFCLKVSLLKSTKYYYTGKLFNIEKVVQKGFTFSIFVAFIRCAIFTEILMDILKMVLTQKKILKGSVQNRTQKINAKNIDFSESSK